jgi:SAM-dependent methyltransferase
MTHARSVPALAPDVMRFYQSTITEADRLTSSADGRLELLRTQELLRRFLPPPPATVLDVGGGAGVHARWLAEDGHRVDLVDPVPRHVEQARQAGLAAELGDARALAAETSTYDVVLLLGPLYHLTDAGERRQALAEAHRVLRPGGLLAVAAINRYASLFEHTAFAQLHKPSVRDSISRILKTRVHDGTKGFTSAYFHSGEELCTEVSAAGFTGAEVFGIEGPTWAMLKATEQHTGNSVIDTDLFESALTAARMAEPYPELLSASSHLLSIGHRPAGPT